MQSKKTFATRAIAWALAFVMVFTMIPYGAFAETAKADWTIDEQKEAEMSFWKLADINEVVVVANAEGMKTPTVNYIGTYINAEGRTVIRVSFRVFQNAATAVWHKALFKFDNDLYNLIDFDNSGTGMYKGVENGDWHDAKKYKEVAPFTDVVSSISGAINVKEQSLKNNKNLVGGNCRSEIPIDLVLKEGKTVADIKGQPHIQMRLAADDYKRIFCVAGTGKAKEDPANNDDSAVDQNTLITPYNSYTFMTYIPSANNNADVNTVEDYNRDYQFYAANSYAKYNEAGGYLDVFHKQSKMNSGDNIGGENFAFRQVFNEEFASVLKPQDGSGTVAEVFPASQQGDMWKNASPIKITEADLNDSNNSDLNPGFKGIQVASNYKSTIKKKFAGLNTVLTTAKPGESYLNGATTEFNSGLPTITRYYIDKDKVAEKGLTKDDLASFDFYSTFILDSTKKLIEYTATNNTGKDIVLKPDSTIGLTYVDGKTSTPNTGLKKYSLTFGEGPYKIELRSNFEHTGNLKNKNAGSQYEYNLIPGMTIKAGEKITFRTMKYDTIPSKVILTLPGTDGDKTIDLVPGADGAELTTPRRLNYITTYAGGSATQSGVNPDVDELFTDSQNITGRTRYAGAKIKLFYPDNTDYEFTIADQKTRTKMNVNGAEVNGYTFTTEGKTGFTMPTGLVKDSQIGITNTDVKKASTPSDKAFEKVQAKVTFDLNGGKLATTVKSFEGFDTTQLPGTEFAYKVQRANDTAPVVRIAPMNEKAAGDADYTANGFNVAKYIDHNGDALKDDALELRKFVAEKPTKDGEVFYGWTTKKVTSVEDYNKLEELKTADQAKDTTKTYKFTENSPILTGMTVYAFYGPEMSDKDVIPYVPDKPDDPTNPDDTNVPTTDKDGKTVDKSQYDIVAFKVADADKTKGSLTLGDKDKQQVISALVKKGSKWDKVTVPTINVADANTKANGYKPAIPAKTETVENGKVYTAQFITNGQEITPGSELPDGVFEVKVLRDETSVKDNALYGKSYAVFKDSKLAQDKFPTPEANDGYKNPAWNVANPWDQAITKATDFKATATSSTFDKQNITKIEVIQDPTKMTYTEGDKPNHDGIKVKLTDKNGNTVEVEKDKLADYGITVTPAEDKGLTVKDNNGKPFVAKVNDKDGKPLTANSKSTITVNPKSSDETVIPYVPDKPDDPTNPDDKNVPTKDDEGKTVDKKDYVIVAFKVADADKTKGSLTLGDKTDQQVISALVKKGSKWDKVTVPTINVADANTKANGYKPAIPAKTETVENGKVYTAQFITNGQEITPGTELPDGVFEVSVSRDETSVKDNALYGKSYAVFKDSKLAQDKFPTPEAKENFKEAKWNVEGNPWDQAITAKTDFKASAVSSTFDKQNITKIEVIQDPTKMTYTEGDKPNHDGIKVKLTDKNGNTVEVEKDKLADYGITVTPAEDKGLTVKDNNGKPFVAKVNDKDGKPLTANSKSTITVNPKSSDETVIPYVPDKPDDPTNPDDKNVPTKDDEGKTVDKKDYVIVAFKVADADKTKGSLTLGDKTDQQVISALVKKGSKWDKVTVPTINVADANTKANGYKPAIPAKTETVENGKVYTAQFITNGQEITPGTKLPDGVFEVSVSRDETSVKDNALYGKSYAVFKDSKLAQDKFPTPEAKENFKEAKWNVEGNPWDQAITAKTDFKASAVSSTFDKQNITKIEVIQDPTKMTYTEGDKPNHDGIKVKLTDKNGNTVEVEKDKLADYGITVTPAEDKGLTVKDNNGKPFVAKVNDKDGKPLTANSKSTITVNPKSSDETVIPYVPDKPDDPTNPDDKNVPTKDDEGKTVDKKDYVIVAFKVADADKTKGSLTLGDKDKQQVISALVKKGSKWDKVTVPTINVADANTKANGYKPAIPAKTETVENGKVYTAQFITNGQEITPGSELPDGVFEVKVLRDETSVKDNALYGKSYAVFKDSKLAQDKFPTPEANDGYKNPAWNVANPWDQAITKATDFKATATSSTFDKQNITKIEVIQDPTKMTYTEGDKPNHDGIKVKLTDKNGNTVEVEKDKLADYGITVTPAEDKGLTVKDNNGKPFVAKVNDKDGKPLTANSKSTITVNPKSSDETVIPYVPDKPDDPTNPDDKNVPTKDDEGKTVDKKDYVIVAFKVADADKTKGSLTLGDKTDQQVISALVKKGSKWDKVTVPTINVADANTKANGYKPAIPAKTETVENGKVYTAQFITNGQEITPGTELPDGVFEVSVSRDETSVKDNALYGKSYAVFKDSKLAQDKFPTPEAKENFKEAKWNVEGNPWDQAITAKTDFKASAVSSTFDKQNITKIEVIQDPTKMTYTEGDKPNHDGIKVKLTDKNGNTVEVEKDKLADYGITVTPAEDKGLTVKDNNGKPFVAKVNGKDAEGKAKELTANGKANITVNPKQANASEKPKVDQPYAGDKSIKGKGVPGATIVVKDQNGNEIGTTTAPSAPTARSLVRNLHK